MILTLIPIRPFYQTSAGVRSVGNGRLRMRPPASLSTVSLQAIYGTRYTETRAAWGSVGEVTLSQTKTKMSETARAVGRERTTINMEFIGFVKV